MPKRNLHIIPTAVALLTPSTFIITYVLAVYEDDVAAVFPYVSATGTMEPESYVFSFLLNITAFLLAACVYVRHLFVKKFAKFRHPKGFYLNKIATTIGLVSCFGLDVVANFQVNKCPPVHYLGASLCFFGGTIYFYMQTMLSKYMVEEIETKSLYVIRMTLVSLCMALLVLALVTGFEAKKQFHGEAQRKWRPEDGGYVLHVISAVSEWLLIMLQGGLVLTFLPAFKCIAIKQPKVIVHMKAKIGDDFKRRNNFSDEENDLRKPLFQGNSDDEEDEKCIIQNYKIQNLIDI